MFTKFKSKFSKFKYLAYTAIPLVVLFVTVYVVQRQVFNLSRASGVPTFIEAESGSLTGSVNVKSDLQASNNQYIEFGGDTSSFQPQAPFYATFFYLWYKSPTPDGSWSYWTDLGNNPPNTWFSHYIPDPNPSVFDPTGELYSANNYNIFKWQVTKLAEARQEVAIASWWGQNRKEDFAFNNIINSFMGRTDNPYPNLRWAMYYENEGFGNPSVDTLVSDLTYIKDKYSSSPYMLKIENKPVMFVYSDASDGADMNLRWSQANAILNNYFYIVLKLYSGYATTANQPNSWHQYAPAVRSGIHAPYSYFVSPGFWLDNGDPERLVRDSLAFETAVQNMVAANTQWKLTETWNEWGEGTSVEPGQRVFTNSSTGKEEIDTTVSGSYNFGNLYVNILNRNLPPLEAGLGR